MKLSTKCTNGIKLIGYDDVFTNGVMSETLYQFDMTPTSDVFYTINRSANNAFDEVTLFIDDVAVLCAAYERIFSIELVLNREEHA